MIAADDGVPTIVIRRSAPADDDRARVHDLTPPPSVTASAPTIVSAAPTEPPSPALQRALEKMREVFHIRELRPGQAEIMESVLAGRDTLAIMPTGSGKSLTYQLPALVMDGPTLVVSPLLALIEDQYNKLKAAGVAVVRIDSTRTAKERAADLAAVREGTIKLVMITPESVNSPTMQEALAGVKFSLFCVDEAHCVSQWGHDFRPSYLGLRRAAQVLGRPPILGLTATATPAIADDVLVQLGMKDPKVCRVSFHRPNLAFDVRKVAGEADKLRQLGKLIQRLRRPGIVYCATVRAVDELYVALRHGKIPVERYNGKMTTDEREKSQASFMQPGRKVVMLATNAFGLGIDKPDIRYIIHYQMPGSPESYVQEAGRAGRDGKPARCVLLFQPDDIAIQEHFLKEAHPTKSQARMVAEGLYAWSDEGKEVSVRDLALSMALPERRVRVILSVLEAMGVAEEVKAARWKGVEPKPTREQIDKAAIGVRGAAHLGSPAAGGAAVVHEHAEVPRADAARLLRRARGRASAGCAIRTRGSTARCSIPASADERHGLHAATDFHARPRRRRRGRGAGYEAPMHGARRAARAAAAVFETAIPSDVLPPLAAVRGSAAARQRADVRRRVVGGGRRGRGRGDARRRGRRHGGARHRRSAERRWTAPRETRAPRRAATEQDFNTGWAAVRDANIRPYAEWRAGAPVTLPVLVARPVSGGGHGQPPRPPRRRRGRRRRRRSPPSPGRRRRARRQIRRRRGRRRRRRRQAEAEARAQPRPRRP